MDPITNYTEVFEKLRRRKRWNTDGNILRFAALTLAAADVHDPGTAVEETAKALTREAGAFSPLGSPIRHAVAAILLRRRLDPARVVRLVKETLATFKEHGLRKGGVHPLLAALLLVLDSGGRSVPRERVALLKAIIERWSRDHSFLTGVDDYPMAAMHAGRGASVEELAVNVEEIYTTLRAAGFSMGNQLQLVSHLLVISPLGPAGAANRFTRLAAALKLTRQRVWQDQYDEVALLTLSEGPEEDVAARVVAYRDRLRATKPRPEKSLAFSIAAGLVLQEQASTAASAGGPEAIANLRAVQSLIEAQQAAMVACMAAASVAATSAAS